MAKLCSVGCAPVGRNPQARPPGPPPHSWWWRPQICAWLKPSSGGRASSTSRGSLLVTATPPQSAPGASRWFLRNRETPRPDFLPISVDLHSDVASRHKHASYLSLLSVNPNVDVCSPNGKYETFTKSTFGDLQSMPSGGCIAIYPPLKIGTACRVRLCRLPTLIPACVLQED